jgi:hypothetical protein
VTQITIPQPIETKNLSNDVGRSATNTPLSAQRQNVRRGMTKPFVPPCRWTLTYYTENGVETHYPIAIWPEDAILAVGRGIPLQAKFDDHGNDRWIPISRHLYAEFACYPQLMAQQAAIDLLKAQRGCGHA